MYIEITKNNMSTCTNNKNAGPENNSRLLHGFLGRSLKELTTLA